MLTVRKNLNVLHICRRVEKVHDSRVEYEKRDKGRSDESQDQVEPWWRLHPGSFLPDPVIREHNQRRTLQPRTVVFHVRTWSSWIKCHHHVLTILFEAHRRAPCGQSCVFPLKLLQRRSEGHRPSSFVRALGSTSRIIEVDLLFRPVAVSSITCRWGS